MFGKWTFPGWFSQGGMCSHSGWPPGNIWLHFGMRWQHVWLIGHGSTKTVSGTMRKTQYAVSLFTFYLSVLVQAAVRLPQGPAAPGQRLAWKPLMHMCPLNHTPCYCSSLNILLSFPPLGEWKGDREEHDMERAKGITQLCPVAVVKENIPWMCLLHGGGHTWPCQSTTHRITFTLSGPEGLASAHRPGAGAPVPTQTSQQLYIRQTSGGHSQTLPTPMLFQKLLFHIPRQKSLRATGMLQESSMLTKLKHLKKVPYNAQFTLLLLILPVPLFRQCALKDMGKIFKLVCKLVEAFFGKVQNWEYL